MMNPSFVPKELIQAIINHLHDAVHVVDSTGRTVWYNKQAAKLDGLSPSEVIGYHILEIFPSLSEKSSTLLQVLQSGKPLPKNRQTYQNRYGKRITSINQTIPIWSQGEVWGALEVAQDVTSVQELSDRILELEQRVRTTKRIKGQKKERLYRFADFQTRDEKTLAMLETAKKVSNSDCPVWVIGETGTGKEIIVQSLHSASHRQKAPFVAQNCASIPEPLLESILFGTTRGAFTGAEERSGLFELADGGTLFLDEIHMLSPLLQAKLLRVLEDGKIRRVGELKERRVDVRILVATSQDLLQNVAEGKIRKDLFYRLHGIQLEIPALRERRDDIPILIEHFQRQYGAEIEISNSVRTFLYHYDWPGNVRELKHVIEGALTLAEDVVAMEHLPRHLREKMERNMKIQCTNGLVAQLEQLERDLILQALEKADRNISLAASILQIPRQTLQYKLKKFRL